MRVLKSKYKSGLVATLDFNTVENSKGKAEPVYIYKDEGFTENNITMSIDETKWLIVELQKLVDELEE